ncbi:MAG TPA: hypothetical protein VHR72_00170, partial [Gemmataceae bacterium]|nr:hypothetical protein [Gemmataceae bacterium]
VGAPMSVGIADLLAETVTAILPDQRRRQWLDFGFTARKPRERRPPWVGTRGPRTLNDQPHFSIPSA